MLSYEMIQSFFTENGYVLELLAAIALFCHFLERKQRFVLRALTAGCALMAFSVLCGFFSAGIAPRTTERMLFSIIKYLAFFVIGFWGILFCFECSRAGALFCMICATATQHLSYRIYACVMVAFRLTTYSAGAAPLIIALGALLVYAAVYFLFVRKFKRHPEQHFDNKLNIFVGAVLALMNTVLQFMMETYVTIDSSPGQFILLSWYHIILCVFTLMIEQGFLQNKALSSDRDMLERLLSMQEEKFQASKASMDMINIKCHDMKHQISRMAGIVDKASIEELEHIITIYDSNLKTGSDVLDVCLMEKKLLCEKNRISFDCIVNGGCLSFMQPADIFSLFGNALDNAIEACAKIENPERRIISLTVREQMGMVVIHLENNFEGSLTFFDGLPQTTKGDKNYHGFGMRSMQMIAEKYRGTAAVLNKDGIFNLNITIPIPDAPGDRPEKQE